MRCALAQPIRTIRYRMGQTGQRRNSVSNRLEGKIALVTGASLYHDGGIGQRY